MNNKNKSKMEKKKQCCTPEGQIKRYVDCVGCDKKPMDTMNNKKQSSIEWLIEQMIKYELVPKGIHFDNILFHQAKAMHKEVKMNEAILNAITEIEKQLAELRELIVTTSKDLEEIENIKKVDEILYQTCKDLIDVDEEQIKSRTRKRAVVDARAICIAFNYFAENNKTLQCIGDAFGVDHSTVLHSVKKCGMLYTSDAQFRYLVNDFFIAFEKNGYNCKTTKQRLTDGHQYFKLKGTITRGKNLEPGEPVKQQTNKIERMSFHCAITGRCR